MAAALATTSVVDIRGVARIHPGREPVTALADLHARIDSGESVAVVGRSGSGKSTLLHLVAGLDRPTRGEIWAGDVAVHALSPRRSAAWRARNVGIVFQFFQLLPALTLRENVMLPMDLAGIGTVRERRARAGELLERFGLGSEIDRLPSEVSGGQQQRAALARALANDPWLILADEPTGNLDAAAAATVETQLRDVVARGRTLVLVTHDRALAARMGRCLDLTGGSRT